MKLGNRTIGPDYPPLVIAEIGINHEGSIDKALRMVEDAYLAGAECVKFQCHVIEDEMSVEARQVIPGNASESIWDIMARCALCEEDERRIKAVVEARGMFYLCTPFSRAAADRLESMGVMAFKIGSGECNNYPLIRHIAAFGRPVILSTGMNDLESVRVASNILAGYSVPHALLQCTSVYPTPHNQIHLRGMLDLQREFPECPVGLSDHSLGNYASVAAVALGASIIEKHFTSDKKWPGPDVSMSVDPHELADLIRGTRAAWEALGTGKSVLPEEQPTIAFAYASIVTTRRILHGEIFSRDNLWVKRPGNGGIPAREFESVMGRMASRDLRADVQVSREDIAQDPFSDRYPR